MKQGAAGAPEARSRFQKVSLVSRRLESPGSARGRDGSPSRVSLLLQAWEREIVEKTGSSPAASTHREHSSSVSLLKNFTAHGPIFSQVYSPAQRPRRQDERGKGGPGRDGSPSPPGAPREVPVHRESYVHGTLLPTRPAERPAGAPGDGPGAPCAAKPGPGPALPRARQVTVLRTGRDAAGPQTRPAEGWGAPNGTHDTAGTTAGSPQRDSPGQDGSGSAGAAVGRENSPDTTEAAGLPAEASPEEKDSAQAEPRPGSAAPGAGGSPGEPQSSGSRSPQGPWAGAAGQADPAGAGQGSGADGDGTNSATPPRTESPPGAGSTPENPPSEVSDGPEPSSETAAPAKAEIELELDETTGDPQGTAHEPESIPEPPAPDPPAESPPDTTEEDPELLVDMEILVDTLRNMEPPEMRKAPKGPRQPRPSALGRCAALPPIHEHRVAPLAPVSLPEALRELLGRGPAGRPQETPEEEEEIENPYLSPEERAAAGTLRGVPRDSAGVEGWVEGSSLLGTLGEEEKAKLVGGGPAERSVLFRGNVLKGMALLSHFLEQRAAGAEEGKPYSRLDKSVLYSRFVSPSAALLELPDSNGGTDPPCPKDHNGLGPAGHSGPEMAMLEALGSASVPAVTEEPESTVTLSLDHVLVSESNKPREVLSFPGSVGRGWGLDLEHPSLFPTFGL